MEYAGEGVKVLTDFTDDREALLATLDKLIIGEGQGFDQTDTSAPRPIPEPPSVRTIASSISSTRTASWPRFRLP